MEQFRLIGEVLGSLKALMVFREEIRINHRQCCLLVEAFNLAFDAIADEIKSHLRFDEKLTKWKALEHPLKELHRIFREGEQYVRQCMESREWWGRAIALNQNNDCIEFHLHNLFWCVPVVVEAIENVGEITGCDQEEIYKRKLVFSKKYEREWMEPQLFQHKLGKLYLVSQNFCNRLNSAWKEDKWILSELILEKKSLSLKPLTKQENRLAELLVGPKGKLYPSSILVGSQDYQVRRRFGSGSNYKEVQWLGENFAVKHVIGNIEPLMSEISISSSVTHPNVLHYMYSFVDEEKKECFVVMDLMSKDLSTHIKEVCSIKRKIYLPLLVAVDTMLQIARGMEYLHSKNIYHGNLIPSNILVKLRNSIPDGYLHVKISGYGFSPVKTSKASANQTSATNPCIWYAPEVLQEQEKSDDGTSTSKYTEKADVYSFAMICFELLTSKIPFEDNHLQGDKMSKNIRAGERPLFSFQSPKYLTNLTKRCWHSEPAQRPSFSSICRVLRYIKRFLIMNPEQSQSDHSPTPPVDYFDIELSLSRRFPNWTAKKEHIQVTEIPFQMYAYRVVEREKTSANVKDKSSESGSDGSNCSDENTLNGAMPDETKVIVNSAKSLSLNSELDKKSSATKMNGKAGLQQKSASVKLPNITPWGRSFRTTSERRSQQVSMSPARQRRSGHASDSEVA